MHARLTVIELPHILDLICTHLTTNDLIPCTQVSTLWHFVFQPQLLRHIRFVNLKKEKTWDILDHASRIRSLKIDIADGGWFLIDSIPTATTAIAPSTPRTETTPPCFNLEWLHCVDFGYFTEPTGLTDEQNDDWEYPIPAPPATMNRTKPHASAGVSTNALRLIQQNPKLHSLIIKHGRHTYGVDHFTPRVLQSISTHPSITLLDIQLNFMISLDFLESLLRHLPLHLQELYIIVDEFVDTLGANTTNHHHHSTHSMTSPESKTSALGCLRKICLRTNSSGPESSWEEEHARTYWEHYFQCASYPERVILPLLQHSPHLQELVLGGYSGLAQHLAQTLFEFCPDLEVLDFGGSGPNTDDIAFTYSGDEPLAEGRMLSKLRTFRLRSFTYSWWMQDQIAFSEIMARSAGTLEIVWLEVSDYKGGWASLSPFRMHGAEEDEKLTFPRLKELVIRTGRDWVYPDITTQPHDHHRETSENHGTHGSGLGSVPLFISFPVLERLSLIIGDSAPSDCEACNGSLGHGRKDKAQIGFLERQRLERQEFHQQQFASRFRQLVSCFRSCAGLKKLELHWQLCETIRSMTREDLLERANGDHSGDRTVGSRSNVEASEGAIGKESVVGMITAEDLDWMDLLSLPTRAQVAQRKASKDKVRQHKEWEKEVLEVLEANLPITRYSDPFDPLYRRVGRGWQDWLSLAGRCGCEFELAMRKEAGGCSGSGSGRRRRICDEYESRELE